MKANKVLAMTLAMAMTAGMLAGCGSSEKEVKETKKVEDSASEGEQITLNYWTWFPSKDQIQETVDAFEKENPDIKINMTVMESKAFQEKVPLALSTEEDIDVIGVQPSAFAEEVQDYLANLDELMPEAAGENWKDAYSEKCLEQGNQLTGGDTKMLVLTNSGSMVGFYNAALLKEIGAEVPKTFEEYKAVAEAFKEKYPDKYVSVFAGKDSWVVDEMMLTVLGQQGDYYNKWRYDGEPVDSEEFKEAINGLKKYFDEGIFSADVLDLDYASATEEFTNGDALVYYIADYQSVYKNVSLELDGTENNLPTDERLRRVQNGKQDLGLSCLFFHYNRYLMIASSRKGTQPANLQGIWSESIRPVWSSNWTTNINTEMNYWLNGPCNLIESFEPFVDFVEELSHAGEETAKKQCHCSGWTANHNVDIWRQTGPVDGEPKYAYWPMGGVWLCSQSYEYFRYSEDLKTLKNKIYPSLRGSVLFCLDWMQQREDGLYYTAPSTSPENTFEDDEGHSCGVSYMTTMDLAIIKELFANYLAAADVLGIEEDLIKLVKERSKLLPGYQIGKTGMIQEWIKDFEKSDVGHRHFSPVFGFHPGHSIKKTDTELVQACQNFIEEKAENFKQQIGWSCAWLINLWARLGDGTKANHYYEELLRQSVYDNLFDLHPPLGETEGEREVFQIDGNFGSASGVAEMLISSEKGKITILPALPDSWKNGKVRGLLAAGAIEVDITWKDRKPVSVSLRSSSDQNVSLFYRNRKLAEQIELKKQEQQIINLCSC